MRLVRVEDLGAGQVVEVETDDHGTIAVGMADGVPFATGNVCRHWAAKLGRGQVRDGCLECPWHGSRLALADGAVLRGPATSPQRAFDVREQDGRLQVRVRV